VNFTDELTKFGVSEHVTRAFGVGAAPELVNYLDFLPASPQKPKGVVSLDGAVEHDHRPILYYINHSRLSASPVKRSQELATLNKSIASRGERAYLAVVRPGLLEVLPVQLGEPQLDWQIYDAKNSDAVNFYSNLVHGRIPGQEGHEPDLIFVEMYKLLLTGADQIAHRIGRDNVLSLIGRALFFRFLCDRGIVTKADTSKICSSASELHACFDDSENTYQTSKWLDETFNGHFLPLSDKGTRKFFEDLNRSTIVYLNLKAIVRGLEPAGTNEFQHKFSWDVFDFAHVPVGLLSQVYEAFSWRWEPENALETSVHYTPRNIATTLVEEAFDGLENPANARVLDPACGAGVFLVLAFRRLYMERWRRTGARPDTAAIRQILETQLCGFDISESALRLAALSLYLTAVELDPNPLPPEKLKFKDLAGLVIFNQRHASEKEFGSVAGSIRQDLGDTFDSQFDLVLCNPPWSKIDDAEIVAELDSVSKQIVLRRNQTVGDVYQNPRGEPDLPFVWRATEWCRPGGQIAMVLPSRILFRQGDVASQARSALFQLIRFTGVVNFSNVRKTNVWTDMDQPFMLAFARNELPDIDSKFWFLSPQADFSLNRIGEVRVDAHAAHILEVGDVLKNDWLLKALAIGTALDVDVVSKLLARDSKRLGAYWEEELNLTSRQGYSVDGEPQKDASSMKGLLDAGKANETPTRFTIVPKHYKPFSHKTLRRNLLDEDSSDPLRVYRAPLLLLRQSLPNNRRNGNALTSYVDIAYNKSFYGYSAHGNPDSIALVQYLHVIAHTNLWIYFALCVSAKLGFERTYFYKKDLDSFPIIPLDKLTSKQLERVAELATRLESEDESVFGDIDIFFGTLYGLTQRDLQVIGDTLSVRNPHDEFGVRGSTPPTTTEAEQFCSALRAALGPFARKLEKRLVVELLESHVKDNAFRFVGITSRERIPSSPTILRELLLSLADQSGASIVVEVVESGLLIGVLNQYRYWTISRARLLAADILRDYFSAF
jgi:type I restriction-modification system DNA methylase subunit